MRKHWFYLLMATVGLALVVSVQGCGKSTQTTAPNVVKATAPADSVLTLVFDTPGTISELTQFARDNNLKILELRIKRPEYVAGFRLDGRDLTTAGEVFASEHRKFLNLMLSQKAPEMATMRSAAMSELSTLSAATIKTQAVTVQATSAMVKDLPMVRVVEQQLTPDNPGFPVNSESLKRRVEPNSIYHPSQMWASYGGSSEVNKSYSYQTFIFNSVSKFWPYDATYEHETHIIDKNYANQTGYWSSNLPYAYLDCGNFDSVDNFAVGSMLANQIRPYVWYYAYIGLYGQSAPSSTVTIFAQVGQRYAWSCWYIWSRETAGPLIRHYTGGGISWQF
ncbi:MAG: hypothetical protein AAB402_04960 [Patescibacteria group bacterium]